MDEVIYKVVEGWPGYRVGNDGTVWTQRTKGPRSILSGNWRLMKQTETSHGYLIVGFRNGRTCCILHYVHQLVLEAFVAKRPKGLQACHGDGNRKNNRLGNLRWGTPAENSADMIAHGTMKYGSKNRHAKLTEKDIPIIEYLLDVKFARVEDVAAVLGVGEKTIRAVVSGKTWNHVPRTDFVLEPEAEKHCVACDVANGLDPRDEE